MIKELMHDPIFLAGKSEIATKEDLQVAQDLLDTLMAHKENCVGMAANMIGERKRIIAVVDSGGSILVMLNPELVSGSGPYTAEEGCLSLLGTREAERFKRITVSYEDVQMCKQRREFKGDVAQAIQHEIDHCNGVLI